MNSNISYKQIVACFLIAALLAQLFHRTVILVDYYSNTRSYAISCVNTDKPLLHCNGKCQLAKKLRQEEKKDEQAPERRSENRIELTAPQNNYFIDHPEPLLVSTEYARFQESISKNFTLAFFHPPQS